MSPPYISTPADVASRHSTTLGLSQRPTSQPQCESSPQRQTPLLFGLVAVPVHQLQRFEQLHQLQQQLQQQLHQLQQQLRHDVLAQLRPHQQASVPVIMQFSPRVGNVTLNVANFTANQASNQASTTRNRVRPRLHRETDVFDNIHHDRKRHRATLVAEPVEETISLYPETSDSKEPELGQAERGGSARHHQCNICGKILTRAFGLKVHLRVHSGERPFACDSCTSTFTQSCNLIRHQRRLHPENM